MPIRFYCRQCQQLLAIASRKAGSEIECPKCGEWQGVPAADPAGAADAAAEVPGPPEPPLPKAPPLPPLADLFAPPPLQAGPAAVPQVLPPGMVLVRRRTVHLQSAFFFALTIAMFGLGYWLGRENSPPPAPAPTAVAQPAALEPSLIEGQVIYENETGKLLGDVGAVVLALAEGKPPTQPLVLAGAEPDPAPADAKRAVSPERQKAAAAVRAMGGAYARVEGQGSFSLVLRPGNYRILFISAHARRPKGDDVDEADLAEMRRYFAAPDRFIGPMKHSWGVHAISSVGPGLRHDFGRDEANLAVAPERK